MPKPANPPNDQPIDPPRRIRARGIPETADTPLAVGAFTCSHAAEPTPGGPLISQPSQTPRPPDAPRAPRIAIVGAGPGGLSAAVLLSARGCRVTVYEANDDIGGRTGQERLPAPGAGEGVYRFDRGPTFFLMPYVLDEIFAAAGRKASDYLTMTRLDPMYRLMIGRRGRDPLVLDTTQDLKQMAERIRPHAPADADRFEAFINENRAKLDVFEPILRKAILSPTDLLDPTMFKALPKLGPHKSVHDDIARHIKDEHVRLAVCFQSKYLGMSPFDCPSLFTILPYIEYAYGVWHPQGGCHAVMRALAACATDLGADIRVSTPVERITFTGKKATGVVVDGEETGYDAVVVNADATWALRNLVPASVRPKRFSDDALNAKKYSCSTAMLYLGLDGEVDLPHHTIYTSTNYTENLANISDNHALTDDPSIYVCNPSRTDPTMAPPGKSALYILVPTPSTQLKKSHGGKAVIDWDAERPRLRREIFEQLEKVFGIEDAERRAEAEKLLTPADWQAMNISFGATFNLAHNLGQMLHQRPGNRVQGLDRLYLVGGGTHPGSGLPTIFLSAQISAKLLGDDLGMRTPAAPTHRASKPSEHAALVHT
ncbi:MAG: phytoene desaturase [Planctomycetes bacterium]|nr:phytoene desaturase [Planctomycetota bacterium]